MLIGEVAKRSGVSARMLRHYDTIGLVSPTDRTGAGYRRYCEQDLRRLLHVEALRSLGMGLLDVAEALDDLAFDPAGVVDQLVARSTARLAHEQRLLDALTQVQASGPAAWSDVLGVVSLLRGLRADQASERLRIALSPSEPADRATALLVEAALRETDPNTEGALIWALSRTRDQGVPALADALRSAQRERRHRAVAALAKMTTSLARDALGTATRHSDPHVRARSLLALGARGDADTVPQVVQLVIEGPDSDQAVDVLVALASEGHHHVITSAIAGAVARADATGRHRLAVTLANTPGSAARETLIHLSRDPDRNVAGAARLLVDAREPREGPS